MENGALIIGIIIVVILTIVALPFLALLWLFGAKEPFTWWFENIAELTK